MEFIEVSAKTVNDAITEACQKLTVTSDFWELVLSLLLLKQGLNLP